MNLPNLTDKIVKIVGLILLFIAFILIFTKVDAFVRNQAIDGCAESYRYQTTLPNGASVSYPMTELYERCLDQKGVNLK